METSEVVLRNRARDPNTPTDELLELAERFPFELAANPILPLLALEEPAVWARIMTEVRLAEIVDLVAYCVPRHSFKRLVCWGQGPVSLVPHLWWHRHFESGYGMFFHSVFAKNFSIINNPRKRLSLIALHYPARPVIATTEALLGARCVNHFREILKHGKTTTEALTSAIVDSFRCLALVRGFFEMESARERLTSLLLTS